MTIKAVVFDFDDCLIRNFEFAAQELVEAANVWNETNQPKLGIPGVDVIASHYYGSWGEWVTSVWPELDGHVEDFLSLCVAVPYKTRPAMPGAAEMISELKSKGVVVGILMNREGESLGRRLKESGLGGLDFVHSTADRGLRKPNPMAFDSVIAELSAMGIRPAETLYVGDQLDDMSSEKAGIRFVAVCSGVVSKGKFLESGVKEENIIPSVDYLPKYLKLAD